jgi:hypothetical protein
MRLEIETTTNGYILRDLDPESPEVQVFEAYESDRDAFAHLVMALAEYCGHQEDRFKNNNLRVNWDGVGRKYVEIDEKTSIIGIINTERS